jgi:hypothetical protein
VCAAILERWLQELADGKRLRVATQVRGGDRLLAVVPKALHQLPHGAGDQAEGLSDVGDAVTLLGALADHESQWHGSRMWHEQSSLGEKVHLDAHHNRRLLFSGKTS